jgi:hypothetical protein
VSWHSLHCRNTILAPSYIFYGATALQRATGHPNYRGFTIILRHATIGRIPLEEWSARRRVLYLTTYKTHKRLTSMSPEVFEPAIPASEKAQIHALDRAATRIVNVLHSFILLFWWICLDLKYRVTIKSFPNYKHLSQENYVEYKHIFFKM